MTDLAVGQAPLRSGFTGLRTGIVMTLLLLLLGFVSIVWTPYPVAALDVGAALQDSNGAHWLGTDQLGRDVLSLLMKGVLTSFIVSAIGTVMGAVIGLPLGVLAARFRGPGGRAVSAVGNYFAVLPILVVAALTAAAFGPGVIGAVFAIGVVTLPAFLGTMRAGRQVTGRLDYVGSARLAGLGGWDLVRRHSLPRLVPLLLAQLVSQLGVGVLAEAALSYVGLGIQPPATSLGLMLHDAQTYAVMKPGLMLLPGLAVTLIVLSLGLVARGLRTQLDPDLADAGADRGAA